MDTIKSFYFKKFLYQQKNSATTSPSPCGEGAGG